MGVPRRQLGRSSRRTPRPDRDRAAATEPERPEVPLVEICEVLAGSGALLRNIVPSHAGVAVLAPKYIRNNRIVDDEIGRVDSGTTRELALCDVVRVRTSDLGSRALVETGQGEWLLGTAVCECTPRTAG